MSSGYCSRFAWLGAGREAARRRSPTRSIQPHESRYGGGGRDHLEAEVRGATRQCPYPKGRRRAASRFRRQRDTARYGGQGPSRPTTRDARANATRRSMSRSATRLRTRCGAVTRARAPTPACLEGSVANEEPTRWARTSASSSRVRPQTPKVVGIARTVPRRRRSPRARRRIRRARRMNDDGPHRNAGGATGRTTGGASW